MTRLQIYLAEDERTALQRLASFEMRGLKEQIRFVLHEDLSRRGLLAPASEHSTQTASLTVQGKASESRNDHPG